MCERVRCKQCDKVRSIPEEVFVCSQKGCSKIGCCHRLTKLFRRATEEDCRAMPGCRVGMLIMITVCDICLEKLQETGTIHTVDNFSQVGRHKR